MIRTLEGQIVWCGRAQWTLGIGIIVLVVAFYVLGYRPQLRTLTAMRPEIAQKRQQLSQDEARTQLLPRIEREVAVLKERLDSFDRKLPRHSDLGTFLEGMAGFRQQYALRKWDCQPRAERRMELFAELPLEMNFEGDFLSVFAFMRKLEDMQRLTRLRSLSIRAHDGKSGQVDVQMAMNIYFSES